MVVEAEVSKPLILQLNFITLQLQNSHILKILPVFFRSYNWKILTSSLTKISDLSIFSATLVTCGWEDNIKIDLQELALGGWGMDWIDLAQDRDRWWAPVNAEMKLPYNAEYFLTS